MNIIFFFPLPIVLALLLNEIKVQWYKKVLQTLVYVPHFVSMVVIASITFMLVKTPSMEGMSGGALYEIVKSMTPTSENSRSHTQPVGCAPGVISYSVGDRRFIFPEKGTLFSARI